MKTLIFKIFGLLILGFQYNSWAEEPTNYFEVYSFSHSMEMTIQDNRTDAEKELNEAEMGKSKKNDISSTLVNKAAVNTIGGSFQFRFSWIKFFIGHEYQTIGFKNEEKSLGEETEDYQLFLASLYAGVWVYTGEKSSIVFKGVSSEDPYLIYDPEDELVRMQKETLGYGTIAIEQILLGNRFNGFGFHIAGHSLVSGNHITQRKGGEGYLFYRLYFSNIGLELSAGGSLIYKNIEIEDVDFKIQQKEIGAKLGFSFGF